MTVVEQTPGSTPRPPAPARRGAAKGQGQWALGHREPLNGTEQMKKDDDGLNVRRRIETIYAKGGFASIDPTDLRGRMRWWGLYTQRRPGIDGGRTGMLEPHELEDEYFMLRVRVDGGALTPEQLRTVGELSTTYARDTADITDRQNIQLHWVRIEDVPAIWERLDAVGLSTTEACGDVPRVVLGSPVAGVSADEVLDPRAAISAVRARAVGNPEFSNLPRKYKTAISGMQDIVHEANDCAFVGVVHPELGPGFDLWVGGGLSTNPILAKRLGVWVAPDDVADVWAGVTGIFRDYGYRRLRNRARLKFLVSDWGVERFREVLETEYLHRKLPDGPSIPAVAPVDHVGVHRQKDGRFYVGATPTVGRTSGTVLTKVAELAAAHGSGRLRTTPMQKLLVLDVPEDRVESLVEGLEEIGLRVRPSSFRAGTLACTGIEFCKLAIVETKARAASLVEELEKRIGDLDSPISINVNGCPNSCARVQVADIGLKGQLVTDAAGNQVEGFQVHLGGGLGLDSGLGRKLRGHKVTADELPDYVERLVRRWQDQREEDERFAQWVARADEAELR
ncbi:MAG: nitrite/sulfite reductase [Motilibacteraceae bacterium]